MSSDFRVDSEGGIECRCRVVNRQDWRDATFGRIDTPTVGIIVDDHPAKIGQSVGPVLQRYGKIKERLRARLIGVGQSVNTVR